MSSVLNWGWVGGYSDSWDYILSLTRVEVNLRELRVDII
jgi:hypothetical protein